MEWKQSTATDGLSYARLLFISCILKRRYAYLFDMTVQCIVIGSD
jgi:hypothetical protein